MRVGAGPARPAPPPSPAVPRGLGSVPPAPLSFGLAGAEGLSTAFPSSRVNAVLVPWLLGRWGHSECRGFGEKRRLFGSGPGFQGIRALGIPVLALSPVSWEGGFRLPWSETLEELGLEEDGWQSSGPSESRGMEGVRGLRSSPFLACILEGRDLRDASLKGIRYFNCLSPRGRGEKKGPPLPFLPCLRKCGDVCYRNTFKYLYSVFSFPLLVSPL